MSITDELRKWGRATLMPSLLVKMEAIADRIDAEHERAVSEQPYTIDMVPMTDESMAGHGWVRLPKDADGVPIRIGDVMEPKGSGLLFDKASFEVRIMRCDECGWEVYDRLGGRYVPSLLRHHHAPTVEDVLTEFAAKLIERGELTNGGAQTIAEYAAKLRLREDAC